MKSQHYNSQVYLRQFTNPKAKNELWEYNLTNAAVKKSSPQDCGCEDYFNSVELQGGGHDDETIEKAFFPLENDLQKLFKTVRNPQKHPMNEKLWGLLYAFAAIQYARSPATVCRIENSLDEIFQAGFEMLCKAKLGIESSKVSDNLGMQTGQGFALVLSLQTVKQIVNIFRNMKWIFLCAPPGKYFLTSDKAVCDWVSPEKRGIYSGGLNNHKMKITFPLTRGICAFGHWNTSSRPLFNPMPAADVDLINYRTIRNGKQFVYGPLMDSKVKTVIEEIVRTTNVTPK
ncbi:MAG: DUF4238 domain-containing protein [Verrucomicrobiota bacterium]|jgi:hypothetical protein